MNKINVLNKIEHRYKIAFLSTLIFGLIAQGMALFNKFSFHDDVAELFGVGATTSSGRWMLELLSQMEKSIFGDGHYSLPIMNGLFSIACIGIAAVLIVYLLEINLDIACIFVGAIMVVFPMITSLFSYMFTAPFYMLALCVSVCGVVLVCKRKRMIAGAILIACAIGVYQAFIPVVLSLMLMYFIKLLMYENVEAKEAFSKMLMLLGSCVLFMAIYLIMNKIFLNIYDVELTSYQGISTMGAGTSATEYIERIGYAYKDFIFPTKDTSYNMYPMNTYKWYMISLVIMLVLLIHRCIRVFKNNKLKGIMFVVAALCIPLAVNFIFVMVDPIYVHSLMTYGQVFYYVLFVLIVEQTMSLLSSEKVKKYLNIAVIISTMLLVIMYARFDNQCYLKATFVREEVNTYMTTLVTQIKSTDGYKDEYPVVFMNQCNIQDMTVYDMPELSHINIITYADMEGYINSYVWTIYMNRWCGYNPIQGDPSLFYGLPEYEEMPHYPDDGSIKVIDETVVVKF